MAQFLKNRKEWILVEVFLKEFEQIKIEDLDKIKGQFDWDSLVRVILITKSSILRMNSQ